MSAAKTPKEKIVLTEISSRAWEHPADKAAMTALKAIPAVNELAKFFIGFTGEASLRLLFLSSAVRVGENQFPRVHRLVQEACRVLDVYPIPETYVTQNPVLNAGAVGVDKAFITLNSALVEVMDDDELLGVIAHEVGHIASKHVLYKTLLWLLVNVSTILIPMGQAALIAIILALREWDRKSELSADRAGLLVTQDPEISYRILMKLAGGPQIEEMNLDQFVAQAEEYDAAGTILDSVHKLLNLVGQTHPFPVLRLNELKNWSANGSYQAILSGNYEKRGEKSDTTSNGTGADSTERRGPDIFGSFGADFESAQKEYREELKRSKDPLAQALAGLGDRLDQAADNAKKTFEDFFKGPKS